MRPRGASSLKAAAAPVNGLEVCNYIDFFFFFSFCVFFFSFLLRCEFAINLKGLRCGASAWENKSNKEVSCGGLMFIAALVDCWDPPVLELN